MEVSVVERRRGGRKIKCSSVFIAALAALLVLGQLARAMPRRRAGRDYQLDSTLDGGDDDDMDQTASAPHRNRDNSEGSSDGYEENEPDGPYGETPREEEGQADLERFFDDHLGASERDGMDKENLPTNVAPLISDRHDVNYHRLVPAQVRTGGGGLLSDNYHALGSDPAASFHHRPLPPPPIFASSNTIARADVASSPSAGDAAGETPSNYAPPLANIETRYIKLPDRKVLIARKVTTLEPLDLNKNTDNPPLAVGRFVQGGSGSSSRQQLVSSNGGSSPQASDVLATENDDYDQVYVTNKTNQPFRIEALGGYDPEEDFQDASRDIEEPTRFISPFAAENGASKKGDKKGQAEPIVKDINFNDPETDNLFDASETDEVTFNQDEPYQTDQPNQEDNQEVDNNNNNQESPPPTRAQVQVLDDEEPSYEASGPTEVDATPDYNGADAQDRAGGGDNDESDSNWINDGVDDMEVPSQKHQDMVLAKAERAEAEAQKRRDAAEAAAAAAADRERDNDNDEEESQRMPNADYLKDDTQEIDDKR